MEPLTDEKTADAAPPADSAPLVVTKALVLFNEKAGSVRPDDKSKLIDAITAAGVGHYAFVGAEKMSERLFANAATFDVIIVLGGDGTARAAAELAPREGPPLILLPGGTLNILPRALYGELAWPEALTAALQRGVIKRLPVGRANGQAFYVAALFGAPTLLARAREAVREGKPLAAVSRLRHYVKRAFARKLRARADRGPFKKAEAIGVLCPSFSGELESEHLEYVSLNAKHFLDLARVSLRALTQDWRNDSTIEIGRCSKGDIYSPGVIPATLDGEPRTFLTRVRISYDPRGPRVIALES